MPLDSPFDSLRGIRSPFGGRRGKPAMLEVDFAWDGSQLILGNNQMVWDGEVLQLNSIRPYAPEVAPLVYDNTPDNPRTSAPKVAAWYIDADGWKGNPREDVTITYDYDEYFSFEFVAADPDCRLTHTDAGTMTGPNGYHVYQAPGTYNPTATLRDRAGNVETINLGPVTADDPDVFYPGTKTICFSRDTNFPDAPVDAQLITITDGKLPQNPYIPNAYERILFKKGETFFGNIELNFLACHVGAFGTASTPPYLNYVNFLINDPVNPQTDEFGTGAVIDRVHIGSDYDASADNNWEPDVFEPRKPPTVKCFADRDSHALVNGCRLIGMFTCVTGVPNLFNNEMRSWFNYGSTGDGHNMAGNVIAQPIGARKTQFSGSVAENREEWNTTYLAGTAPDGSSTGDPVPNRVRHAAIRSEVLVDAGSAYCNFIRNGGGHGNDQHQPAIRTTGAAYSPEWPYESTFSNNHVIGHINMSLGDERRKSLPDSLIYQRWIGNILDFWDLENDAIGQVAGRIIFDNNLVLSENNSVGGFMKYAPVSETGIDGPIADRSGEIVMFRNNTVAYNNTKVGEILPGFGDITAPQVLGLGNILVSAGNGWSSVHKAWSQNAPITEVDADFVPTAGTTFDFDLYDYVVNEGPGAVFDFDEVVRSKPTKPGYKEFT